MDTTLPESDRAPEAKPTQEGSAAAPPPETTQEPDVKLPSGAPAQETAPSTPETPPEPPKDSKDGGGWYNQPLTVGVLILVGTYFLQQCGWKAQQRFIIEQSKTAAVAAQAQAATEQVTTAVGKLLTAYAIIVGAHEAKVERLQLNETIRRYHELQMEWDQAEDLLKLRVRKYFPSEQIESDWSSLLERLGDLDTEVKSLHEFDTTDRSEAHINQIKQCTRYNCRHRGTPCYDDPADDRERQFHAQKPGFRRATNSGHPTARLGYPSA